MNTHCTFLCEAYKHSSNHLHKMTRWLDRARDHLDDPVPTHTTHFHVAFIFLRGKLLASATNQIGSRSRGSGYSTMTLHAERAVLKELGDISKMRGSVLVVVRIGKDGSFLNSKPCSECELYLDKCVRDYGLRYYIHS